MKKISWTVALALIVSGMATHTAFADADRFAVWDNLDSATARLFNDQQIGEDEDRNLEEALGLGRSGKTEEAIEALNEFLKESYNKELREVVKETMSELTNQRRAHAVLAAKRAIERTACTLDIKICPDGVTVVGREGSKCAYAKCPQTHLDGKVWTDKSFVKD